MKIGLGTYALAWSIGVPGFRPANPMDVYGFMQFAHDHGFNLVQIADNLPLHRFKAEELMDIVTTAKKLGIEIEVGTRGLTIENVEQYLKISATLNSSLLRIVIDQGNHQPSIDEIHSLIQELIPLLEQHNISLAIENHDRLKASEFKEIVEKANSKYIGICLDSVNSIGADEGFEYVFKTLAPYTINVHLKDYSIKRKSHMMGFDIEGVTAGEGRLPVINLINTLQKYGNCHSLILELWPPLEVDLEKTILKEQDWVKKSAQYLFDNII